MNAFTCLRTRLAARADSEHEQAIYRVALLGLIAAFFWGVSRYSGPIGENDSILLRGLVGIS